MKKNILFLCIGNSCRSQMAEGWTRALKGELFEAFSAGSIRHGLHPRSKRVMAEAGVDISGQFSKTLDDLPDVAFDYVVTLCGHDGGGCPIYQGRGKRVYKNIDDPLGPAMRARTEEEALNHFRRARDEIRAFVEGMPENLG